MGHTKNMEARAEASKAIPMALSHALALYKSRIAEVLTGFQGDKLAGILASKETFLQSSTGALPDLMNRLDDTKRAVQEMEINLQEKEVLLREKDVLLQAKDDIVLKRESQIIRLGQVCNNKDQTIGAMKAKLGGEEVKPAYLLKEQMKSLETTLNRLQFDQHQTKNDIKRLQDSQATLLAENLRMAIELKEASTFTKMLDQLRENRIMPNRPPLPELIRFPVVPRVDPGEETSLDEASGPNQDKKHGIDPLDDEIKMRFKRLKSQPRGTIVYPAANSWRAFERARGWWMHFLHGSFSPGKFFTRSVNGDFTMRISCWWPVTVS
ncbi:uncharacterized protein LY89DRAFT_730143 [Mollisia scopiformis]|uniref:Uncharacterized protein n=1 Tax=Mollisia scopiformis TaxID=149040 RepID=A0A194XNQ2_MOLSC|nr:uncharacterized protein LY89DRAFT_730143 [Mollisia scopiformis]KUJ21362.1 hypothetical protein LY89DRAFT_730143 [Mollisia scopiformis]